MKKIIATIEKRGRATSTINMIEEANNYFRRCNISDEKDITFNVISDMLIKSKIYHGFQHYTFKNVDGVLLEIPAGNDSGHLHFC